MMLVAFGKKCDGRTKTGEGENRPEKDDEGERGDGPTDGRTGNAKKIVEKGKDQLPIEERTFSSFLPLELNLALSIRT